MKILLFEDDEGIAFLTKEELEKNEGYQVDVAHRGKEGLEKARAENYDVFLLDQMMPDYTGLEVFQELQKIKNNVVLALVVTGSGDERIAVQALKMGVSDYVVKSLDMQHLKTLPLVIEKAVEQRRLITEKDRLTNEWKSMNEELKVKLKMLETFEKVSMDREKRILELKEEINRLKEAAKK